MKSVISVLALALVLGVIAPAWVYQTITAHRVSDAIYAAGAVALPFFGVAFLAALEVREHRKPPAVRVLHARVQELLLFLVLSGLWVFFILLIWGL